MNNAAIEKFCIWARGELIAAVSQRAALYGIRPDAPIDADAIEGKVLSVSEKAARGFLMKRLRDEGGDEKALAAVVEQGAYTWFNRFVALRYMEVNERLPSRVRVFSAPDGEFVPQILSEALNVTIEGLDRARLLELLAAGDDEATFRYLLLAQCHELADCLPDMFDGEDAWELLLPEGLLRNGGVIQRLVDDIDEDDWQEGVQIVGWMYQYYNAERKREVFDGFKKGNKAERFDIAPATQLFTPDWIVRYLVENSLGRLWIRSHPSSPLKSKMKYFIEDEDAQEDALSIISPEDITLVDPACGSAHMLVYAFDLLFEMYAEAGYVPREAARLIIEKNLTGIEIDQRAAALASFALSMKVCEGDSRFLARDVTPRIHCLSRIALDESELSLAPSVAVCPKLVDAMAHLDECGSLFVPEPGDVEAIDADLAALEGSFDLFADAVRSKLSAMKDACELLSQQFDVIVANPPYMGSSNMDKWLGDFTKKSYPDAKRDLCTCFIERGFTLCNADGYSAMVTMQSWMFLGSFEVMRNSLIAEHAIVAMAHLGARAFDAIGGEVVSTTATVFSNHPSSGSGVYVRLVDYSSERAKEEAFLEAIANPECGWFYRRAAEGFKAIPGSPIAYWASDSMRRAFKNMSTVESKSRPHIGLQTGDNERFLRFWWEVGNEQTNFVCQNTAESLASDKKWYPCNKGGEFRRWYGNQDYVVDWAHDGKVIVGDAEKDGRRFMNLPDEYKFRETISWSMLSSSRAAFRFFPDGFVFEHAASAMVGKRRTLMRVLAFCNSEIAHAFLSVVAPTINFNVNCIAQLPICIPEGYGIEVLAMDCVSISRDDWDSFETSWDFQRHPMV